MDAPMVIVLWSPERVVLQTSPERWTALASRIERDERARNEVRPNLAIPNRIRAALSATDDAMVRVSVDTGMATRILGAVG